MVVLSTGMAHKLPALIGPNLYDPNNTLGLFVIEELDALGKAMKIIEASNAEVLFTFVLSRSAASSPANSVGKEKLSIAMVFGWSGPT